MLIFSRRRRRAVCSPRFLMSSLMPRKLEVSLLVPCGPEIDTMTKPTGLPSMSEVGPALPTMAMP